MGIFKIFYSTVAVFISFVNIIYHEFNIFEDFFNNVKFVVNN